MAKIVIEDIWDNLDWLGEFGDSLGPEFWMWKEQENKERTIEELLDGFKKRV